MDRDEAIKIYKEIVTQCQLAAPYVSLVPHRKNDTLSRGYQLHIKSTLSAYDRQVIQRIVDGHKLAWKEEAETLIIYKPMMEPLNNNK